jgi:uncharacterized protein (TIGR03437 family)
MRVSALWIAMGCALALGLAQDGEAPPAIAQWGISNWASRMPPQLPAGGVAPGSLIRIRGWRLGPAPLENIAVRIRRGETHVQATPLAVSENEIEALVPSSAPPGAAMLQVVKNGNASLEWPVAIVESSFGAFARNGEGWGPGEITNAGGAPNSEARPARPGEAVTLAGTGLGARPPRHLPQVLVAGRAAKSVRVAATAAAGRPGVDMIEFDLPQDTPEGCNVPVQVGGAPGIYSNAVTLAVSRSGGPCANTGWSAGGGNRPVRLATVALLHADLLLDLTPKQTAHYPVDAGFASFAAIDSGASANPLFLLPPPETCTGYSGTAGLHSITSPLAALEALPGTPLDAGLAVTVAGPGGNRSLPRDRSPHRNYWAVLGGHSPAPGAKELPLFLTAGDYQVSTPGASSVGAFQVKLRAGSPLVWRNREQLAEVDRSLGATVTWRSASGAGPSFILIVAMNTDSRSGALGVCACLANGGDGSFRIPPYALANIPQTPLQPRGFPLNLILLAELPETPAASTDGTDVDRILAFATSISGRTVRFK